MTGLKPFAWLAVLCCICDLGVSIVVLHVPSLAWALLAVLLPAAWAARDSHRGRAQEYDTSLAVSPAMLFLLVTLCWVVVLPRYLAVRYQIQRGHARRGPSSSAPLTRLAV